MSKPTVSDDAPGYLEGSLIQKSKLPLYTEPKVISDEAYLPANFLASMSIKSLPGEYFVQTYSYFKYFDSTQRIMGGAFGRENQKDIQRPRM